MVDTEPTRRERAETAKQRDREYDRIIATMRENGQLDDKWWEV